MTDYTELQKSASYAAQDTIKFADEDEEMRALQRFHEEVDPETVLALIAENKRLAANVKLNLCDHPAIHSGDVELLTAFVLGTSQIELAKVHGCTPPNISRKIRRVKQRLGWREGMSVLEIRGRAEHLRALASQGAVVTADLMAERDQLKAENEALRKDAERYEWICANACDLNFYAAGPAPIRGRVEIDAEQYPVSEWGSAKPELDSIIDAAMSKGEQS